MKLYKIFIYVIHGLIYALYGMFLVSIGYGLDSFQFWLGYIAIILLHLLGVHISSMMILSAKSKEIYVLKQSDYTEIAKVIYELIIEKLKEEELNDIKESFEKNTEEQEITEIKETQDRYE